MAARRAQDSRTAIFEAAQRAFVEGDGDFEIGDVARRAGVSVGLAYHYFGSKAGLVSALITDFYDRYDAVANRRFEKGLPWPARERRRLLEVIEFLFADPMAPLMLGRLSGNAEVLAVESARREALIELAVVNISKGQARGEIDPAIDAEIAAAAINGGLRQAVAMALKKPRGLTAEAFTDRVWGLVAGALSLPR